MAKRSARPPRAASIRKLRILMSQSALQKENGMDTNGRCGYQVVRKSKQTGTKVIQEFACGELEIAVRMCNQLNLHTAEVNPALRFTVETVGAK